MKRMEKFKASSIIGNHWKNNFYQIGEFESYYSDITSGLEIE